MGDVYADYCDMENREVRVFDAIEDLEIIDIKEHTASKDEMVIVFKPPFAKIFISDNVNVAPIAPTDQKVYVTVSLPNSDDENDQKSLVFDAISGLTERVYEE